MNWFTGYRPRDRGPVMLLVLVTALISLSTSAAAYSTYEPPANGIEWQRQEERRSRQEEDREGYILGTDP